MMLRRDLAGEWPGSRDMNQRVVERLERAHAGSVATQ